MKFKKILIAVDEDPIVAHTAEVSVGMARSLNAQVALIHAVDLSVTFSGLAGEDITRLAD